MNDEEVVVPPVTTDEPVVEPDAPEVEPETPEGDPAPEQTPEQLQATNKKLFERAKKAEAELKALKGAPKPADAKPSSPLSVEETVLLAQGMPEALVTELKAIAKLRKTTMLKAQTDPIFVAVKEKFEKDKKQRDASLPGSRGAGGAKPQKTFTTPGLSREEHKAMVLGNR